MLSLAWKNISRRLGSSAITIAVIFVAVFSVVSSSVVLNAPLNQGADLSRQRLGADVMVLPQASRVMSRASCSLHNR